MATKPGNPDTSFDVVEATIDDLHAAIRDGATTLVEVVQQYIDRAKAYNGVAGMLVTEDGQPVPEATGTVRAGAALTFPTETVAASDVLPDLDKYAGPPLEYGRMEATASDPDVQQQFGMLRGVPEGGQLNALQTLNIRGERSVTCKGDFDRHPSEGPLPAGAPPVCEIFRQMPDALERAAELDAEYGNDPDLEAMPMYGVVFSFKDPFDTKDMRSTGGADAAYDIDFPARDHTLVAQLRNKGAIIFAKAVLTEYNGRAGDPGGTHKREKVLPSTVGYQRSTWAGNPANPYDTTRAASLGSSSGSGVSVSANLVMASLGEETRASTRGPANHNSVALILPHKALISFHGNAIGADIQCDRTGILCRRVADSAKVLDALKDPEDGYYDPRDPWTAVPRSGVLDGYAKHIADGAPGVLTGMRIGIVRESMIATPGSKTEGPITTAAATEIKAVLADTLSATLVESRHSRWEPDPDCEQMTVDFRTALCRMVGIFMPNLMFYLKPDGTPLYPEFAAAIEPTEFAPGKMFGSGELTPMEYFVGLSEGRIEPPADFDIRNIQPQALAHTFQFHIAQYLMRRSTDWAAMGFEETLATWSDLNARSKFWGEDHRAGFANWEETADPRNKLGQRQGIDERIMLRELLRRIDMMVILENKLDCLVRLHTPWAPAVIGGAHQPAGGPNNLALESLYGPNAGLTEILIPAGFVTTVYDPVFKLSEDGTRYESHHSDVATELPEPGLPFSLTFRAEPGMEDVSLKVASAYEAASNRRVPPPAFGAL
ncbi:MAG: amidase family protein [Alphaproteobacteria bacterium]